MKRVFILSIVCALFVSLTACGAKGQQPEAGSPVSENLESGQPNEAETGAEQENETEAPQENKDQNKVASDDAEVQTDDPDMPTRVPPNGTAINMHFGDVIIPGVLNDSDTAKALIELLPYTVHMSSYSHDFCGVMPDELTFQEDEVHYGWLNGDIDYAINAPYFTILHSDEEISEQYGYQVNIGVITCELSRIRELSGSYDVLIELAE